MFGVIFGCIFVFDLCNGGGVVVLVAELVCLAMVLLVSSVFSCLI